MKKLVKIIGIVTVIAVLGVMVLAATALAQEPADGPVLQRGWMGNRMNPSGDSSQSGFTRGMMGGGFMMTTEYHDQAHAAMAEALGLTVAELDAAMAEGKNLYVIAAEQGVELADVWAAQETVRQAALQQAVADGLLTQEQVDWMSDRMANRSQGQSGTRSGRMMGGHGGGHGYSGGSCGGYFAQPDTTN